MVYYTFNGAGIQWSTRTENKGAMGRLMTVKISHSCAKHLIKHGGLCIGDQGVQCKSLHRHFYADGFRDRLTFIASSQDNFFCFKLPSGGYDLSRPACNLFYRQHTLFKKEAYATLIRLVIKC